MKHYLFAYLVLPALRATQLLHSSFIYCKSSNRVPRYLRTSQQHRWWSPANYSLIFSSSFLPRILYAWPKAGLGKNPEFVFKQGASYPTLNQHPEEESDDNYCSRATYVSCQWRTKSIATVVEVINTEDIPRRQAAIPEPELSPDWLFLACFHIFHGHNWPMLLLRIHAISTLGKQKRQFILPHEIFKTQTGNCVEQLWATPILMHLGNALWSRNFAYFEFIYSSVFWSPIDLRNLLSPW